MKAIALPLLAALLLGACASTNPDLRPRHEVMRMAQVQDGTVVAVRPVRLDGHQTGLGATAGAVAGSVAGGTVGGRRESVIFSTLGAILGGVIGHAIERESGREQALELIIQLRNGERIAIVQSQGEERFAAGDKVMVVSQGRSARVTRALPPVPPEATAPAAPTASAASGAGL